jgi:hypothetical protein
LKWYFCLDAFGANREIGAWAELAVKSARKNTSLHPVCLFDGPADAPLVGRLKALDVEVIIARSRLADVIENAHRTSNYPIHGKGAFLRAEIPRIAAGDEHAFYTDCDVFFFCDPQTTELKPDFFSAGPRQLLSETDLFNSGVLYFNVERFRSVEDDFFAFCQSNLFRFLPGMDEPLFNEFFRDKFDPLPVGLNWRPFFGYNRSISVLHFHGPKLEHLAAYLSSGPDADWGPYAKDLTALIASSIHSYYRYIEDIVAAVPAPDYLDVSIQQILRLYPKFCSTIFELHGEAALSKQIELRELSCTLKKRQRKVADYLFGTSSKDDVVVSQYRFEGSAVTYPHLLIKLFSNAGVGELRKVSYAYKTDPNTWHECFLDALEKRACETEVLAGGALRLSAHAHEAQVVVPPQAIPNRNNLHAILVECREGADEDAAGIFADSQGRFFAMNGTTPTKTILPQ